MARRPRADDTDGGQDGPTVTAVARLAAQARSVLRKVPVAAAANVAANVAAAAAAAAVAAAFCRRTSSSSQRHVP